MNFLNIKIFISEMGSHLTFVAFLLRFVLKTGARHIIPYKEDQDHQLIDL
jgi:hypothetical protein